ncbi:MAG: twin-arginine translocation signal domain-containing protein [Akkermansia muciniphila]
MTPLPPFSQNEVPQNHPTFLPEEERGMTRRSFMKWMGAGAALAGIGLPACRRVEKYLVPYNEGPEWSVPGVETAYATCLTMGGNAQPVLAACYEGRPVKLIPPCNTRKARGCRLRLKPPFWTFTTPAAASISCSTTSRPPKTNSGAFSSWSRNLRDGGGIGLLLPPRLPLCSIPCWRKSPGKIHSCASTGIPRA